MRRVGQKVTLSKRHHPRHWTDAVIIGLPSDLMARIRFEADGEEMLVPRKWLR